MSENQFCEKKKKNKKKKKKKKKIIFIPFERFFGWIFFIWEIPP